MVTHWPLTGRDKQLRLTEVGGRYEQMGLPVLAVDAWAQAAHRPRT